MCSLPLYPFQVGDSAAGTLATLGLQRPISTFLIPHFLLWIYQWKPEHLTPFADLKRQQEPKAKQKEGQSVSHLVYLQVIMNTSSAM